MFLDAIVAGTLSGGKPSWIPLFGEGRLAEGELTKTARRF
jgi:hypothetical protein